MRKLFGMIALTLGLATAAAAQAPAGAPAGANGICKDGTYSMQAKKDGACRGHKGVQTWYLAAAPATAATPAPTPAPKAAAAPTAVATPAPTPQSAPAPATTANGTKKLSPAEAAAQKPLAPGGGPGLVWVNTSSNVYHCSGDPFYGKTKAGSYMSEADAKAKGAHGERGKTCAGK